MNDADVGVQASDLYSVETLVCNRLETCSLLSGPLLLRCALTEVLSTFGRSVGVDCTATRETSMKGSGTNAEEGGGQEGGRREWWKRGDQVGGQCKGDGMPAGSSVHESLLQGPVCALGVLEMIGEFAKDREVTGGRHDANDNRRLL